MVSHRNRSHDCWWLDGGSECPPYCLAQGDRAKLAGLNRIGLRRRAINTEEIDALHAAYRTIFVSDMSFRDGLAHCNANMTEETPKRIREFLAFFNQSKRGVCKGRHVQ